MILIMTSLIILLALTLGFGLYVFLLKKPSPVNCSKNQKWNSTCTFPLELFEDATISAPKVDLELKEFTVDTSVGGPLCVPVWYCFRYVNPLTGGYGPMSEWTKKPIIAGSKDLPCPISSSGSSQCGVDVLIGKEGENANSIVVGTTKDLDMPVEFFANVHRFIGETPPEPDIAKTEIVGFLIQASISGDDGFKYKLSLPDTPCSPNPFSNKPPLECKCSKN